jgi:hypothetical protein
MGMRGGHILDPHFDGKKVMQIVAAGNTTRIALHIGTTKLNSILNFGSFCLLYT